MSVGKNTGITILGLLLAVFAFPALSQDLGCGADVALYGAVI